MGEAQQLYGNRPEFFAGQTFAESPLRQEGIDLLTQQARDPNNAYSQGVAAVGQLLDPNMDRITDYVKAQVMPSVNAQFQRANRSGSPAHARALTQGLTMGLAPHMLAAGNQTMQAAQQLPGLSQGSAQQLYGTGQMQEGLDQRAIDEAMRRHAFGQDAPWQHLQRYSSFPMQIGRMGGQATGTRHAAEASPLQQMVGVGTSLLGQWLGRPGG